MAWRDTLNGLRDELAEVRAERQHQTRAIEAEQQRQREELNAWCELRETRNHYSRRKGASDR